MGLDDKVIKELQEKVEKRCDELGLSRDRIDFHPADQEDLAMIASYGHKERHSHWSFGAQYLKLKEMQKSGMFNLYELVIPTSPVKAYLNKSNTSVEDKLVINHVYGHVDFHLNNINYSYVDLEKILDQAAENAVSLDLFKAKHGDSEVEDILDACLTVAPYANEVLQEGQEEHNHVPAR